MRRPEPNSLSFIIRIWIEAVGEQAGTQWRGHITPIPDGKRHYIQKLRDVDDVILPYLESLGVRLTIGQRAYRYMRKVCPHIRTRL